MPTQLRLVVYLVLLLPLNLLTKFVLYILLLYFLRRKIGPLGFKSITLSAAKTVVSSAVMAIFLVVVMHAVAPYGLPNIWMKMILLLSLMAGGIGVFLLMTRVINPTEYRSLVGLIRRKIKK